MRVTLPWPPSALTPNSRVNRWEKARITKAHRYAAWVLSLAAKLPKVPPQALPVTVTLHQPLGVVPRDRDNAIAATKAGQDGVADAIGLDDRHWVTEYAFGEPVKGGAVVVDIRPALVSVEVRGVVS